MLPRTADTTPVLFVLLGPTGVGKTDLSIRLAERLQTEILSADSRQVYRELPIGTAMPTTEQQARVPHHCVGHKSVIEGYSVGQFEREAMELLQHLWPKHRSVLMVGGSGLYIDGVCQGIDDFPEADTTLRAELWQRLQTQGIEQLRAELRVVDPQSHQRIDPRNSQRIVKALEVSYQTGRPYSSWRTGQSKERDFRVVKIGLDMPREQLYARIDQRVHQMLEQGLEAEARAVFAHAELNALNTVGYKELFDYFRGQHDLTRAVELIQRNSRHYAKKQLTWFRRYNDIRWFAPTDAQAVEAYCLEQLLG